jgi:uncharacterized protein
MIFGAETSRAPSNWRQLTWLVLRDAILRQGRRLRHLVVPKHDLEPLQDAIGTVLGDRLLGESLTRLLIPAYHPDRRTICVFKTAHHERFEVDHREKAVDVAVATAAAPTYFHAHALPSGARLIDGGIWANNPMGMAVVEAISVLGWEPNSLRVLGCPELGGVAKLTSRYGARRC